MATAPGSLSFSDPITQLAARNLREPQKDVFLAQQATSQEAEPILDRKARAQEQFAQSNIDADTRLQQQQTELTGQLQDYSKFTPTPENKDNLMKLFALTAATTFLGGGGRQSGVNAMTNLASAVQGYGQGRQDLFERELQQYHANIQQTQLHNQEIQQKIQNVMQLWTTDRDKAQQELTKLAAETDSALIKNAAKMGNLDKLSTALQEQQKVQMQMQALQMRLGTGTTINPDTVAYIADAVEANPEMLAKLVPASNRVMRQAVADELAQRAKERGHGGGGDLAASLSELRANQQSLNQLTKQYDAVTAFEKNAVRQGNVLLKLADNIDTTGTPVLEKWIRAGRQASGDPDVAEFNAQMQLYRTEAAKLLTNPSLSGQLTDSARQEVEEFLSNRSSAQQIRRIVRRLETDFSAREETMRDQMTDIRNRIAKSNVGKGAEETAAPPSPGNAARTVTRTGKDAAGRKVVQYSDGSVEYAD